MSVSPYPILSVTRDKASMSEDGGTATFTITSSSAPTSNITVNLLTGGTYVPGDLTSTTLPASGLPFTATLSQSATTISLPMTGVHDPASVNRTVTLMIQPDTNTPPAYTVGAPASASVVIQDDGTYTLTVNSSGNGTTSPTVAYAASGVATSITAAASTGYLFFNWTVAAGSGATFGSTGTATSTSASDTVTLTGGNATVQANFIVRNYYVNASAGNDSNAGTTSATAFKTITKAISVATVSGQIVNVAAGTYNTASGETFPLYIPAGVTLAGNIAGKGSGVLIQGGGQPSGYAAGYISNAVVMGHQSVLEGFTITNNSGLGTFPMGVLFDQTHSSDGAIVHMNTITGNPSEGIYVNGGSSGGSVDNNIFTANGSDLAFVSGGGNGMSVSYNAFSSLVELDTMGPDLGGGAAGSPGHNSFLGGTSPTWFGGGGNVFARNNHWNNSPPTVGPVRGGFDVGITNSTTVDTTGYY